MEYFDIYKKRVNRYGLDYQSRIQNEREKHFDLYLLKSIYRVDFIYNDDIIPGSFEKFSQDETKTLHYLLTQTCVEIPNGTVLMINNDKGLAEPWMVYYLEEIHASGYNRYVMLRMTHNIKWLGRDKQFHESYAYLYGQENNMLKDEIRSRSRMDAIYSENLKASFLVLPKNSLLKKDDYIIVGEEPFTEYFRVTGYDIQSSDGVEYVTIDPIYEFNLDPPPEQKPEDNKDDFFWLTGGKE